jgi:hypothetical protein
MIRLNTFAQPFKQIGSFLVARMSFAVQPDRPGDEPLSVDRTMFLLLQQKLSKKPNYLV